ncbi:MAG: hypothetical protein WCQ16_08715 [Verrucomicrobiae bacterium]
MSEGRSPQRRQVALGLLLSKATRELPPSHALARRIFDRLRLVDE